MPLAQRGPGAADRLDPAAPVTAAARLDLEVGENPGADRAEQVVLVADVRVEGHRLDAELGAEAAHRQRVDAVGVGEIEGALHHPLAGQRGLPEPGSAKP